MLWKNSVLLSGMVLLCATGCRRNFSPKEESIKQFNIDKPAIEQQYDALTDEPESFVGDINDDGLPDCILSVVMTPKDGGNMIVAHECFIYINTGSGMRPAGTFPDLEFCYAIDNIKNNVINIKEYECAPPYNTYIKTRKLIYRNGKVSELK
jgi:hypothetical protein